MGPGAARQSPASRGRRAAREGAEPASAGGSEPRPSRSARASADAAGAFQGPRGGAPIPAARNLSTNFPSFRSDGIQETGPRYDDLIKACAGAAGRERLPSRPRQDRPRPSSCPSPRGQTLTRCLDLTRVPCGGRGSTTSPHSFAAQDQAPSVPRWRLVRSGLLGSECEVPQTPEGSGQRGEGPGRSGRNVAFGQVPTLQT